MRDAVSRSAWFLDSRLTFFKLAPKENKKAPHLRRLMIRINRITISTGIAKSDNKTTVEISSDKISMHKYTKNYLTTLETPEIAEPKTLPMPLKKSVISNNIEFQPYLTWPVKS